MDAPRPRGVRAALARRPVPALVRLAWRADFPFLGPAIESLEHRLTILVQQRVMGPLLRPVTIGHLENPEVVDQLRMAQQVGSENFSAQQALGALNDLTTIRLASGAAAVILFLW